MIAPIFRKKEVIGDCTLYLADCRDVLPTLKYEVLLTDPVWPNCPEGLLIGSENPQQLFADMWQATRSEGPSKRAVIVMRHDSDPRFLQNIPFPYARAVILPYVMPGYIGRYLGGDEIAYCFGQPIPSRQGQRVIPGRAPPEQPAGRKENGHPCSRAIGHFKFLVRWWSEPEETVVDPFMGSGTTGEACISLGRKFVGIEVEEKYFDIACKRLERAQQQPDMFLQNVAKPKPRDIFYDYNDSLEDVDRFNESRGGGVW